MFYKCSFLEIQKKTIKMLQTQPLKIEDATSTRKGTNRNTSNESWRPSVIVNNNPENQHSCGKNSAASESKFSKRKK